MIAYEEFKTIFDEKIFAKSKSDLLKKVADYPDRYVGLFRPTKPHAKLIQNLLQSNEIRFGDAFEVVIEKYLESEGWSVLPKSIKLVENEALNIDQLLGRNNEIIFIEQKVRDDHDSAKKRGQVNNFEKKIEALVALYPSQTVKGFFYFIDPSLVKNKNFYEAEMLKLQNAYGVELSVSYGSELFNSLSLSAVWDDIIDNLNQWRQSIPDLPEVNFDLNPQESFDEIKDLPLSIYRKIFDNERIVDQILPVIFPSNDTLLLLNNHIRQQNTTIANTILQKINVYLNK